MTANDEMKGLEGVMEIVDNVTILGLALGFDSYYPKDQSNLKNGFNHFVAKINYNQGFIEHDLNASSYTCFDQFV